MRTTATVYRFDPERDASPAYRVYEYQWEEGQNVLEVLLHIQRQDPSFAFLYGCREHHCGLCGVMVDGKAGMACKTNARPGMTIEPLRGLRVVKDLVVDRGEIDCCKDSLQPYLHRKEGAVPHPEQLDPEAYQTCRAACRCVECLCCMASCPVWQRHRNTFAGPALLVLEAQYRLDGRDSAERGRLLQDLGIDACVGCGACSRACGYQVDPCGIIRAMGGGRLAHRAEENPGMSAPQR